MGWNGLERNKLDYILTDLLPVEVSELFSFSKFYDFLLEKDNYREIRSIVEELKKNKAKGTAKLFENGWSATPLKYKILKGRDTMREMGIVHPMAALNIFLFMECYQNDILNYMTTHNKFSIRYHKKNTNLYYKKKNNKKFEYFNKIDKIVGRDIIQQTGNYFKISPFQSINSFMDSHIWRKSNFKFNYYAKLDYKSCFDSIYTHSYSWIIEKNAIDSKNAKNSNLFLIIDRVLQNINGMSSNGVIVGPEFSRMVVEILLQHIDEKVMLSLLEEDIRHNIDYAIFRYVDDIFIFAKDPSIINKVINKYQVIGEAYLLRLNELKIEKGETPFLPKEWLERTRQISDVISKIFYKGKKVEFDTLPEEERHIIRSEFIPLDRLKDEIAVLIKTFSKERRAIVSFLLSTLLNNVSKKKNGYNLFGKNKLKRALLIIELAFYIYAYFPSFDQTRKIISIITYINEEVNFKNDEEPNKRLGDVFKRYEFIFLTGNIFDLCDWFPFFQEYKLFLDVATENFLINEAEKYNNPIIWANLLLYSRYHNNFYSQVLNQVSKIIEKAVENISSKDVMLHTEFWYVLVFFNCPDILQPIKQSIKACISTVMSNSQKNKPSDRCIHLIGRFLTQPKGKEGFIDWSNSKNFGEQVTYRTYQRTVFKHYKNKYGLYASIN